MRAQPSMSLSCCCASLCCIHSARPRMRLAAASLPPAPKDSARSLAPLSLADIICAKAGSAIILRTSCMVCGSCMAFIASASMDGSCMARESAAMPSSADLAPSAKAAPPWAVLSSFITFFRGAAMRSISAWNAGSFIISRASRMASGSLSTSMMLPIAVFGSCASLCRPARPRRALAWPASMLPPRASGATPPSGRAKPRGTCA
mmetsp:Transcript_14884/g.50182  ORF Transcript_14884/g.50182 Transcript_14884/m.50182 type:complete len:205 (+) Transcript_14884:286-900(+)